MIRMMEKFLGADIFQLGVSVSRRNCATIDDQWSDIGHHQYSLLVFYKSLYCTIQ